MLLLLAEPAVPTLLKEPPKYMYVLLSLVPLLAADLPQHVRAGLHGIHRIVSELEQPGFLVSGHIHLVAVLAVLPASARDQPQGGPKR